MIDINCLPIIVSIDVTAHTRLNCTSIYRVMYLAAHKYCTCIYREHNVATRTICMDVSVLRFVSFISTILRYSPCDWPCLYKCTLRSCKSLY